jgi:serine/threonine protein kinase
LVSTDRGWLVDDVVFGRYRLITLIGEGGTGAVLNAAHQHRLVHRDVKPSNALLTGDDFVYLIDFGIAHDAAATRLTSTGMTVAQIANKVPTA